MIDHTEVFKVFNDRNLDVPVDISQFIFRQGHFIIVVIDQIAKHRAVLIKFAIQIILFGDVLESYDIRIVNFAD